MSYNKDAVTLVLLAVIIAVLAGAGYNLVRSPEAEITNTMVGGVMLAFGLIINHLFGRRNGQ